MFDAFFQKRDWLPALALAEELVRRRPDVARLQKALIATLSNMKRFDEAILRASQYIERHGEELTVLDALKVAHFYTGKIDEAIRYGQRGIEIRDAEAAKIPRTMSMTEPRGAPQGDNVISFSLWGTGAVLQLWRDDQSGTVPQRLSGLGLPLLRRCRRCRSHASPICATTAPTCATWKTNIPASACSSASW